MKINKGVAILFVVLLVAALQATPAAEAQLPENESERAAAGILSVDATDVMRPTVWTDRADLEQQLLRRWAPLSPAEGPGSELELAIRNASENKLALASTAETFDDFISRLRGPVIETKALDMPRRMIRNKSDLTVIGVEALTSEGTPDLTFVPIAPCRIFDTRSATAGIMAAAETRGFYTNSVGSPTLFSAQGGDASGCPEIPFDPPAVMLTVTAINQNTWGYAALWAYTAPAPNASHLNWSQPGMIANSTIAPTCYACGPDISVVVQNSQTHLIGDVMGYFKPKDKSIDLNVHGAYVYGNTIVDRLGLRFPDASISVFGITRILPDDYTSNAPIAARFVFRTAGTSCGFAWYNEGPLYLFRPGSVAASLGGGGNNIINGPSTANQVFTSTVALSATAAAAGDALAAGWYRAGNATGDTCAVDVYLIDAQLIYE